MDTSGMQRLAKPPVLLDSEGGISTSVGVIDHGIEGLVDPLPEEHGWCGPETERPVTHPPPLRVARHAEQTPRMRGPRQQPDWGRERAGPRAGHSASEAEDQWGWAGFHPL